MEEWKEYKLGEVGTIVGGATPSTKDALNYDGNISWITPKDLSNYSDRFIGRGERMISQKGYDSCSCKMLPKGTVLFSSRAPIGYVAIAKNELCTNQGFKNVVADPEIIDNIFLYYLLVYNRDKIEGMGSGTTFKEVSGKVMSNILVTIPSLPTQQKIANILSSLDDKIEVNRRINAELEELAQALFKSWFVDFEPFKEEEFVESELGMIPKGWKVCELADLLSITKESINPSKKPDDIFYHYSIPAYDNSKKAEIQLGSTILSSKFKVSNKTTLFSKLNPRIKRVWFLDEIEDNAICSTEFVPYKALDDDLVYFIDRVINSDSFYNRVLSIVNGATGSHQRFHPKDTLKFTIPYNEEVAKLYNRSVEPILKRILVNQQEITHLTALRDALLPKLMSGEIDVTNNL